KQKFDEEALRQINRRQAWQFEMLPVHFESTGELLIAASRSRLARAVTFAASRIDHVAFFRIAESEQLRQFLKRYYPLPGVSQRIVEAAKRLATTPPGPTQAA